MTNLRTYTDSAGVHWLIYRVEPQPLSPTLERLRDSMPAVPHERRRPWLLFESESGEKRRLVPVPDEWDKSASNRQLADWCAKAEPVPPAPERRFADLRGQRIDSGPGSPTSSNP